MGRDGGGFVNAITDVARSDSLLFMLDGMAQTISVFREADGAPVRSFGGEGSGPGEFGDPMALAVFDDTVYVVDPTLGPRVSVFMHDGTFVELRDLEVSGSPTDIVADAEGLVVITPFLPEQKSGQRHVAHRLTHGGEWLSSSCTRDGRFEVSEGEGGVLARMQYSIVTATTDAISCTQPISPAIQVIDGEVPGLSYAPPFYKAPEDRPLADVLQSGMFGFLSTWTSHGEAYVWRDRFYRSTHAMMRSWLPWFTTSSHAPWTLAVCGRVERSKGSAGSWMYRTPIRSIWRRYLARPLRPSSPSSRSTGSYWSYTPLPLARGFSTLSLIVVERRTSDTETAVAHAVRRPLAKPMLAVSCVVLCAACVEEPSDPGTTDHAAALDLFAPWPGDESFRLAAEPSLVVGSDESLPLGRVSGAVFFGDGIAIASVQFHEVLILDASGRLLSRHGRNGDGPGEYKFLAGIARHADGLLTWDANHFRLTQLDASGGYVGQTVMERRRQASRMVGAFGNSVLFRISERGFPGPGYVGPMEIRLPVTYEIVRLSDGEVVFEGTRPGEEEWAAREASSTGGRRHGGLPVIFGRTAVAAVTDNYAYLATTDSITITRYDEAGTTGEVAFEQPKERAEEGWERFVRDTTRASIESIEPGQIFLGGRNFMEVMTEFRRGLLEDLPARPTLLLFPQ